MYLFLHAVSENGIIASFDDDRKIIDREYINIKSQESAKLPAIIDNFVSTKIGGYALLKNIVVVHGPGSFTGIRAVVLTVNTLSFVFPHIYLTPLSYFDLFGAFPKVKMSSKKDVFCVFGPGQEVQILQNQDFIEKCKNESITQVYGEEIASDSGLKFENSPSYDTIIQNIELQDIKAVNPYYIKKPSIS